MRVKILNGPASMMRQHVRRCIGVTPEHNPPQSCPASKQQLVGADFCNGWWRVSQWELDGLPALMDLLKSWLRPQGPKASGAPKTVSNPKGTPELLGDIHACIAGVRGSAYIVLNACKPVTPSDRESLPDLEIGACLHCLEWWCLPALWTVGARAT